MSLPSCPTCTSSRADELKRAVSLFVDLWQAVSDPSDRLGLTYFRTAVDPFDLAGDRLPLLTAGGNTIAADVDNPNQTPHDRTAMEADYRCDRFPQITSRKYTPRDPVY